MLTLPLPPTANTYYRMHGGKMLLSADGRAYKARCATIATMQGAIPVRGLVAVSGTVYMARLGCDLDNRIKPLLDSLKGIAFGDDVEVSEIHLRRDLDRANPRVEIEIRPSTRHTRHRKERMSDDRAAAGPWQAGDPPEEGRYLVQYRQGQTVRVFIGDWLDGRWSALLDAEILRWAEIFEPTSPA